MPSVRDLRDRIRSLKNTQQITKAMKQVAAAKIRRAEALQKQSKPYAEALSEMLRDLMAAVGAVDHPFMKPGSANAPTGIILMTSDKGLAGAFNSNLNRVAEHYLRDHPSLVWYNVGIKGRNNVRRIGQKTAQFWALSQGTKFESAQQIAARVSEDFVSGKIGSVMLVHSELVSMMLQRPGTRQLLPIVADDMQSKSTATASSSSAPEGAAKGAVEFAPSPEAVLSRLLPKYLEFTIYSAMLETDAAFFAAQLVAMNNASDNAKKLIDELTVVMNNARQAAITKEILEIVGGAAAQE